MPLIRITRWWDGATLHEIEAVDQSDAVKQLVAKGADLRGADLRGADLRGANLGGANLGDANLGDANLCYIRDDLWAVLSGAPAEAPALLQALRDGKVDGSTYTGECACLVGTLAHARGCDYHDLEPIVPDSGRLAEVWFTAIKPGDTPENSQPAKLAAEWIEDWLARMRAAFTPPAETPAAGLGCAPPVARRGLR